MKDRFPCTDEQTEETWIEKQDRITTELYKKQELDLFLSYCPQVRILANPNEPYKGYTYEEPIESTLPSIDKVIEMYNNISRLKWPCPYEFKEMKIGDYTVHYVISNEIPKNER